MIVRVRGRHRAPRLYRPVLDILSEAALLIVVLGFVFVGINVSIDKGDRGWTWFFFGAVVVIVVLYLKCVWDMARWLRD